MSSYRNYADIPNDVWIAEILRLARENIENTLTLPGVWEAIREEYNNDALDSLCPFPEWPTDHVADNGHGTG